MVRRPPVIRLHRHRRPETRRWTTAGAPVPATPRARGDRWASWLFRDRHSGAPARRRTPHSARRVVPASREPLARPAIGSPAASRAGRVRFHVGRNLRTGRRGWRGNRELGQIDRGCAGRRCGADELDMSENDCDERQRARRGSQHRARPSRGRIAARIEQPSNSLRQLGCEEHTRRQRRCRRTLLEIGELRQTHSEAPSAAGDVHGIVVAGDLAFDLEPPADPPHSRMQAGDAADGQLNEPCVIVPPLHVRPLVQHDLIEFVIGQTLESLRRHAIRAGPNPITEADFTRLDKTSRAVRPFDVRAATQRSSRPSRPGGNDVASRRTRPRLAMDTDSRARNAAIQNTQQPTAARSRPDRNIRQRQGATGGAAAD